MHWPITDCQLAGLEDPFFPQLWTQIHAKISPLCHAGPPQNRLQKSFLRRDAWKRSYTNIEDLELTAGSGFLCNKIINVQSAGCGVHLHVNCDSRDRGAFSRLNKNAGSQLLKLSDGILKRLRDPIVDIDLSITKPMLMMCTAVRHTVGADSWRA
jgi:hypothetical protein